MSARSRILAALVACMLVASPAFAAQGAGGSGSGDAGGAVVRSQTATKGAAEPTGDAAAPQPDSATQTRTQTRTQTQDKTGDCDGDGDGPDKTRIRTQTREESGEASGTTVRTRLTTRMEAQPAEDPVEDGAGVESGESEEPEAEAADGGLAVQPATRLKSLWQWMLGLVGLGDAG